MKIGIYEMDEHVRIPSEFQTGMQNDITIPSGLWSDMADMGH